MKAIGGYPELELRKGDHYHTDALKLNTARNCLKYILLARKYKRVYIPYYTCSAVHQPFIKLQTACKMEFYHINERFEPVGLPSLKEGEAFLYTNYFGLKQNEVEKLAEKYGNRLIVDNSQAFYDLPYPGIDTFYSARKFFGVPDGAYLYTDNHLDNNDGEIETDLSFDRMNALLKRIDLSAEDGYVDFHKVENSLCCQPIRKMSRLTEAILCSIDYESARSIRRNNFILLERVFYERQGTSLKLGPSSVPLCYPFIAKSANLRNILINNRIFVPQYWPNVIKDSPADSVERRLSANLIPLPIDQRYSDKDMESIISIIISNLKYTLN